MGQNESEWEEETNDGAKAVSDFFMSSQLKEEDLQAYFDMKNEVEMLSDLLEEKRKYILQVCKGMDQAKAGKFAAFFKKVAGRESFDWKSWGTAMVGKPTDADREKYTKTSEESIRMEVKRLE